MRVCASTRSPFNRSSNAACSRYPLLGILEATLSLCKSDRRHLEIKAFVEAEVGNRCHSFTTAWTRIRTLGALRRRRQRRPKADESTPMEFLSQALSRLGPRTGWLNMTGWQDGDWRGTKTLQVRGIK